MNIVVTCRNEILREDGSKPFWEGPAERLHEIRNLVARDLAVDVAKDGRTRKSGMWTVEARGTERPPDITPDPTGEGGV